MSGRFVLGLSSHFDDGNKILGKSKPAGQESQATGFGGFGVFFPCPLDGKILAQGHGIRLRVLKKTQEWSGSNKMNRKTA